MNQHVHSFIERHPGVKEKILDLAEKDVAFSDLCARFAGLWDQLNELENEPVSTEALRREVRHLEAEMLAIMVNQSRV